MRYFMQPGLHVPLMALVDYKGHRLIASSILPIRAGETGTIRYGSPDGGRTVYFGMSHWLPYNVFWHRVDLVRADDPA